MQQSQAVKKADNFYRKQLMRPKMSFLFSVVIDTFSKKKRNDKNKSVF